jgi:hypothetical protein
MNPMTDAKLGEIFEGPSAAAVKPELTMQQIAENTVIRNEEGLIGIPNSYLFGSLVNGGRLVKFDSKKSFTNAESSLVPSFIFLLAQFFPFKDQNEPMIVSKMRIPTKSGGAQVAIRAMFKRWEFDSDILFNDDEIHESKVRAIVKYAGMACGLGAFRPNRKGPYGTFEIARWEVEVDEENSEAEAEPATAEVKELPVAKPEGRRKAA